MPTCFGSQYSEHLPDPQLQTKHGAKVVFQGSMN